MNPEPSDAAAVVPGAGRGGRGNAMVASGGARLLALPITAVATLVSTRVVIEHYGIVVFDAFSLVVSMMTLLSVNNLGTGAAITTALAGRRAGDARPERVALTAARVSLVAAAVTVGGSILITLADSWTAVAGSAVYSNAAFGVAIVIICLSFPPLLGQSVLLGVHKNHVFVVLQGLLAPLTLAVVVVLAATDADGSWIVIGPAAALFAVAVATMLASSRVAAFPWWTILRRVPARRRYPGGSIRDVSLPMTVIQLATPIALQADRLILSHFGTTGELANYTVCIQLFAPVTALVTSAAQPLWPMFTAVREAAARRPPMAKIMAGFVLGAVAVCAVVVALAGPLGRLVGSPLIDLGVLLPVANALVVISYAATFPVAMAIMDGPGVRLAAGASVLALPLNVAMSIAFIPQLGAASPLIATFAIGLLTQTIPFAWYFRRHAGAARYVAAHRRPRPQASVLAEPESDGS